VDRPLKFRLSAMMFLEYLVPGATVPILSLYLKNHLHFEPYQAGIVMAMPAVAAMVAPLVASHLADRYLSAERMLSLCHFACALLMFWLATLQSFTAFLAVYFLYGVFFIPTFGLTNTVALHHMQDARRDFGGIRAWGTVGWVVVAWAFGYFWLRGGVPGARLPHALPLSGLASLALAVYSLSFRPAHDTAGLQGQTGYGEVLRLFLRPGMLLLCLLTFLNSACHQFYYFGMSPYLHQVRFPDRYIMPGMSLGQMSEVVVLGLLGWCLTRISIKAAMVIGALAQALRLVMFAFAPNYAVILGGISLHGLCYAFFFTAAYLYVERHSTRNTRAGAQQVLTIMISGGGTLAGFLSAGWAAQLLTNPQTGLIDYRTFWLIPAGLATLIAAWIALGFREEPQDSPG
jgi:nucleoside transporter